MISDVTFDVEEYKRCLFKEVLYIFTKCGWRIANEEGRLICNTKF